VPPDDTLQVIRRWSLLAAICLSGLFIWLSWRFRPDEALSGIAATIFGTSGTIVALALPAAELAGNSISRIAEFWVGRFAESSGGSSTKQKPNKLMALKELRKTRQEAMIARRGSGYVLAAFILAAFSLLTPRIFFDGWVFFLDYVLVGLSCGFLIIGALLFFPFTWSVYHLDALAQAEEAIENFPEQP
jgi:hypothetical protein